jgi:hypothetical protein
MHLIYFEPANCWIKAKPVPTMNSQSLQYNLYYGGYLAAAISIAITRGNVASILPCPHDAQMTILPISTPVKGFLYT